MSIESAGWIQPRRH